MSIARLRKSAGALMSLSVLALSLPVTSVQLQAQALGNTTVYSSSSTLTDSAAYIDASVFAHKYSGGASANDICTVLNYIYSTSGVIPSAGAVIDARGIAVGSGNACAASTSPWPTSSSLPPTTVLLPAGSIYITDAWVLPDQTRIIGAGRTNTSIVVPSTFTTGAPMIQMGSSGTCPSAGCTGVVVSDLKVSALPPAGTSQPPALNVIGIQNKNSGDGSYVSHVTFYEVEGTALDIETSGANNSGPYVDLTPSAGGSSCGNDCSNESSSTACIKIINTQTRGIHGLTCTGGYTSMTAGPAAGVYLDGNNNTIEDAHFEGVVDGIVIGDQAPAAGNVIRNITGASGGGTSGTQVHVIHICAASDTTTPCNNGGAVTDLTLSEIQSYTGSQYAILDDETSTEMQSNSAAATGVGVDLYVLGESPFTGGYTAFNTFNQVGTLASNTTPVPVWGYASNYAPPSTATCPIGSIYSNKSGTSGGTDTIYICVGPASSKLGTWSAFK